MDRAIVLFSSFFFFQRGSKNQKKNLQDSLDLCIREVDIRSVMTKKRNQSFIKILLFWFRYKPFPNLFSIFFVSISNELRRKNVNLFHTRIHRCDVVESCFS